MSRRLSAPLVVALLTLSACSGMEEPLPPLPAEIVGVEVTPEPVAPLDTAVFKVVTSRPVVGATWNLHGQPSEFRSGDTISWVAPVEPGEYGHTVSIREGLELLDRSEFFVEVSND